MMRQLKAADVKQDRMLLMQALVQVQVLIQVLMQALVQVQVLIQVQVKVEQVAL